MELDSRLAKRVEDGVEMDLIRNKLFWSDSLSGMPSDDVCSEVRSKRFMAFCETLDGGRYGEFDERERKRLFEEIYDRAAKSADEKWKKAMRYLGFVPGIGA